MTITTATRDYVFEEVAPNVFRVTINGMRFMTIGVVKATTMALFASVFVEMAETHQNLAHLKLILLQAQHNYAMKGSY